MFPVSARRGTPESFVSPHPTPKYSRVCRGKVENLKKCTPIAWCPISKVITVLRNGAFKTILQCPFKNGGFKCVWISKHNTRCTRELGFTNIPGVKLSVRGATSNRGFVIRAYCKPYKLPPVLLGQHLQMLIW